MADTLALKRRMRLNVIQQDPVVVLIDRVTRVRAGTGRFIPQPDSVVGPFTVRLEQERMSVAGFAPADRTGDELRTTRWTMLTDWLADVRAGADDLSERIDTDQFTVVPYGSFRVMEVVPETARGGGIVGYNVTLRRSE